jgi:hypothetical protein
MKPRPYNEYLRIEDCIQISLDMAQWWWSSICFTEEGEVYGSAFKNDTEDFGL